MEDNIFGEIVSRYTRAEAIEDGFLIDVSKVINLFNFPVAVTCGLYGEVGEDKIKYMLCHLFNTIKKARGSSNRIDFEFNGNKMYSLIHGGDNGEPVITIMLIGED